MPTLTGEFETDRGPVMVAVEYQIDPAQIDTFTRAMQPIRQIRRRDEAFMRELFSDIEHPGRMVECFKIESWH
ncbi:MFS transporter [Thiobacillus sp.]